MSGHAYMRLARRGARPRPENLEMVCRRVDNAFIRRLELGFDPENRALLRSLRANADELQCHVGTFCALFGTEVATDYDLVDFIGVHLKPQKYETEMNLELREDDALLFTRASLRGSVKHLQYRVSPRLAGVQSVTCRFAVNVNSVKLII